MMLKDLRLRYTVTLAFFILSTAASTVPTEQSRGRRRNKRQEKNSSSLEQSIEDALHLDKDIRAGNDDPDSDSDDENRSPTSTSESATPTAVANTIPSTSSISQQQSSKGSSTARNLAIAGGTVGGLILLALIGFVLYRWRVSKKNNKGPWKDGKYPPVGGPIHRHQQSPPYSTQFGGHENSGAHYQSYRRDEKIPVAPKPPPLVLVSRGSEKLTEDDQTFFLDQESTRSISLPPVYEEMRSPSQESSISQTMPYPYRNASTRRKAYKSFQPPPIPESPTQDPMDSRFSWTTKRTSIESAPHFRSVDSWVVHQAGRESVKEKLANMGLEDRPPIPPTPAEFRHHPGAPVSFNPQHQRLESLELDKQYSSRGKFM